MGTGYHQPLASLRGSWSLAAGFDRALLTVAVSPRRWLHHRYVLLIVGLGLLLATIILGINRLARRRASALAGHRRDLLSAL
jgi:hypothetical protein